jgi:hypothetical protein
MTSPDAQRTRLTDTSLTLDAYELRIGDMSRPRHVLAEDDFLLRRS